MLIPILASRRERGERERKRRERQAARQVDPRTEEAEPDWWTQTVEALGLETETAPEPVREEPAPLRGESAPRQARVAHPPVDRLVEGEFVPESTVATGAFDTSDHLADLDAAPEPSPVAAWQGDELVHQLPSDHFDGVLGGARTERIRSQPRPHAKRKRRSRADWRRAIVLSEVLGRPVALRRDEPGAIPD